MTKPFSTVAEAFPIEDCYTIEELAAELDIKVPTARLLIKRALDSGKIQKLARHEKNKLYYAPPMVEQLKVLRESGQLGEVRKKDKFSSSSMKHAKVVLEVPIFDPEIHEILMGQMGSKEAIMEYVQTQLYERAKPILSKKKELEEKHKRELEELLKVR